MLGGFINPECLPILFSQRYNINKIREIYRKQQIRENKYYKINF